MSKASDGEKGHSEIEWRLQEVERAVAALCLVALDKTGNIDEMLKREKAMRVFVEHAARLGRGQVLIGEVVDAQ